MNLDVDARAPIGWPWAHLIDTTGPGGLQNLTAMVPITSPDWSPNGRIANFGPALGVIVTNRKFGLHGTIEIQRRLGEQLPDVIIGLGGANGPAAMKLSMTARELRELASALVSAAHDVEVRP